MWFLAAALLLFICRIVSTRPERRQSARSRFLPFHCQPRHRTNRRFSLDQSVSKETAARSFGTRKSRGGKTCRLCRCGNVSLCILARISWLSLVHFFISRLLFKDRRRATLA